MLGVNESNPNSSLKKKKEKTKAFDFNFLLKIILFKGLLYLGITEQKGRGTLKCASTINIYLTEKI